VGVVLESHHRIMHILHIPLIHTAMSIERVGLIKLRLLSSREYNVWRSMGKQLGKV
jgi:hypothetical protein